MAIPHAHPGHEWARLQVSLHTREALRALRAAARSVQDVRDAAPAAGHELVQALGAIQNAETALSRVEARAHADNAPTHWYD